VFYQCTALLFVPAPRTVNEPGTARAISALHASIPTRFVIGSGQHFFRAPRPCLSATSALTLRSMGRPKGCAFCPPLTSNVRALTQVQRTRWWKDGGTSKSAFNSSQMQAAHLQSSPEQGRVLWSGSERRFALLVLSVNGMRFAQLNSQKVDGLPMHRPSLRSGTVHRQRAGYCESHPRLPCFHSNPVCHRLRSALFPRAASVPFGNQRPNPSVEGTAKRLRLLSAPHLAR
jgi:hypothetical protein